MKDNLDLLKFDFLLFRLNLNNLELLEFIIIGSNLNNY